jgi:hypothetical protein
MKSYYARKRQQLMASAWVDKPHRDKWEFIEKRLHRAMTLDELRDYIGYVNKEGQFKPPKKGHYAVPPGVELSEANGDEMPERDREHLLQLRVESKMGRQLSAEEQAFCARMLRAFPSSYPKNAEIFKLTEKAVNPLAGE